MALAKTLSVTLNGVAAQLVEVEANIGAGLPGTHIVGLVSAAVNQARDRIKIATQNSQLPWPKTKVMVSLLPSDVPKTGHRRSEERRVGKECRSRWSPYQ